MGAGGHGVPSLGCPDGRVGYKFASFWNRNHTFRALQQVVKNLHTMIEAEKQECAQSALRAHSSSRKSSKKEINVPVVVAHRLSTIRNVNMIAVIQRGQVVETGTHDELLAKGSSGAYASLIRFQEMSPNRDLGGASTRTSRSVHLTGSLSTKSLSLRLRRYNGWFGQFGKLVSRMENAGE